MLTSRLTDQRLLANPRYIAEPKLDGQRAQLHVAERMVTGVQPRRPEAAPTEGAGLAACRGLTFRAQHPGDNPVPDSVSRSGETSSTTTSRAPGQSRNYSTLLASGVAPLL